MFFFNSEVIVENGVIKITNIRSRTLLRDIFRVFKTSRINQNMFHIVNRSSIVFYEFFALEMYHIIDDILLNRYLGTDKNKLIDIQNQLLEKTWLNNINRDFPHRLNFNRLNNMMLTPLDHQKDFMKMYDQTLSRYSLKGMLLAAEPGSGKTFNSLCIAECLKADRIIVMCPNPAVDLVWINSTTNGDNVFKEEQSVWACNSGKPYKGERIAIFHYEAIEKALLMQDELNKGKVVVILDESHNLNEIVTKRTNLFIQFCEAIGSEDNILMTGTPVKALSVEIIPLLRVIDPLFTEEVEAVFKKMFAGEATKTTTILSRRLNVISFRVEKKTLNLAEPEYEDVELEIPHGEQFTLDAISHDIRVYAEKRSEELKKYLPEANRFFNECVDIAEGELIAALSRVGNSNKIKQDFFNYRTDIETIKNAYNHGTMAQVKDLTVSCNKFEKNFIIPNLPSKQYRDRFKEDKTIVKYYKLKIQGECLGRILGRKRIDAHIALAKHIPYKEIISSTKKKTVVFTSYREVIESIEDQLRKIRYKPVSVYGEYTKHLTAIVERFENDPSVNPLIATYASLSTAVPLVMADTMIIVNPPFRDYIFKQTVARINRLGATTQTRIFNIILKTGVKPNISSRGVDIIQWSREQVAAILQIDLPGSFEDLPEEMEENKELAVAIEEYHNTVIPVDRSNKPKWCNW